MHKPCFHASKVSLVVCIAMHVDSTHMSQRTAVCCRMNSHFEVCTTLPERANKQRKWTNLVVKLLRKRQNESLCKRALLARNTTQKVNGEKCPHNFQALATYKNSHPIRKNLAFCFTWQINSEVENVDTPSH